MEYQTDKERKSTRRSQNMTGIPSLSLRDDKHQKVPYFHLYGVKTLKNAGVMRITKPMGIMEYNTINQDITMAKE